MQKDFGLKEKKDSRFLLVYLKTSTLMKCIISGKNIHQNKIAQQIAEYLWNNDYLVTLCEFSNSNSYGLEKEKPSKKVDAILLIETDSKIPSHAASVNPLSYLQWQDKEYIYRCPSVFIFTETGVFMRQSSGTSEWKTLFYYEMLDPKSLLQFLGI